MEWKNNVRYLSMNLNRYYNPMPSPIKDHILLRKPSRDDRKLKRIILDINK
jgi:hypothetical protein